MAAQNTPAGLPAELFERVAQHADKASLRALRLTDRECNGKVFRTFAQEHLSTLRIVLASEDSLTKALDACKHPVYAKFIEAVKIYTDEFLPTECFEESRDAEGLEPARNEELYNRQEEMREEKRDLLLLTAIFSRLAGRGRDLKEIRIAHAHRSEDLIPGALLKYVTPSPSSPHKVIIEAMDLSGIRVKSLVIDLTNGSLELLEKVDDKYQASLDAIMPHIEILKLGISVFGRTSSTPLTKALGQATKLKHLEINVDYMPGLHSNELQHFDTGLKTLHTPSLETLHLSGFHIPLPQLVSILRRHENLETTIFKDMYLSQYRKVREDEGAETFNEMLRKKTSVKRLEYRKNRLIGGSVAVNHYGFPK